MKEGPPVWNVEVRRKWGPTTDVNFGNRWRKELRKSGLMLILGIGIHDRSPKHFQSFGQMPDCSLSFRQTPSPENAPCYQTLK